MKRLRISVTLVCIVALFSQPAVAMDKADAQNNFASELVECAVYFKICGEGVRRSGDMESAVRADKAALNALTLARTISRDDVVEARAKLAMDRQMKTIDNDYANISLLIVKYKDICKDALESPDKRLKYWQTR